MEAIKGYIVLTETVSGPEIVWRTGEGDETMPQIFESERAAQLEILDDLQDDILQFQHEEREWDEIHWPEDEYTVAEIEIDEEGNMIVKDDSQCLLTDGPVIMRTTLKSWRENL